jgi:hypothetical protein
LLDRATNIPYTSLFDAVLPLRVLPLDSRRKIPVELFETALSVTVLLLQLDRSIPWTPPETMMLLIMSMALNGSAESLLHNRLGNRQAMLMRPSENYFIDLCSYADIPVMQTSQYRNRNEFARA